MDNEQSATQAGVAAFEVHQPQGFPPSVSGKTMAPRLDHLEGKTVAFLDARFEGTEDLIEAMSAWFADNLPTVRTVAVRMKEAFAPDPDALSQIAHEGDAAIALVGT